MPAAEAPLAVMVPLLVMPPVTMPVILIAFRIPVVPGMVADIVPVFWIAPLKVVTTWIAAVEVPPPEMALVMVPGAVLTILPVPETTMQSMVVVLLNGATSGVQAASAPALMPAINASADVVSRRCRMLRFMFPPTTHDSNGRTRPRRTLRKRGIPDASQIIAAGDRIHQR